MTEPSRVSCGRNGGNCQCTSVEECMGSLDNQQQQQPSPANTGLLGCPFCGEQPQAAANGWGATIHCSNKNCIGAGTTDSTLEDAARAWNKRSSVRAQQTCCQGLAPSFECRCEQERLAQGHAPYRRDGIRAQWSLIGSPPGDGSELSEAARYLADSSERYCRSYEQRGGGDMQTGRAWDAMRRGRDLVRKALSFTSPGCGEVDPTRPACGQGDERGRKPTDEGYGHD